MLQHILTPPLLFLPNSATLSLCRKMSSEPSPLIIFTHVRRYHGTSHVPDSMLCSIRHLPSLISTLGSRKRRARCCVGFLLVLLFMSIRPSDHSATILHRCIATIDLNKTCIFDFGLYPTLFKNEWDKISEDRKLIFFGPEEYFHRMFPLPLFSSQCLASHSWFLLCYAMHKSPLGCKGTRKNENEQEDLSLYAEFKEYLEEINVTRTDTQAIAMLSEKFLCETFDQWQKGEFVSGFICPSDSLYVLRRN